ncbi:MAG: penicillin acylase family protein [Gemmatimonadota bacterium]
MLFKRPIFVPLFVLPALLLHTPAARAQADTLLVAGIQQPVEIVIDRWGIPHIYADTEQDLFFGQGYNAARDRLFQLEMWRRQATGTLAEILGPRALRKDEGARLLKYRGDMERELNHYSDRGTVIFDAFVRGINAYIDETERNPELLPMEFSLLGIKPGRWTEEVVVSRLNGLFRNVTSEVRYAQLLQRIDAETLKSISDFTPPDPELSDRGVDLSLITDDIVELYRAARAPVEFVREDILAAYRGDEAPRQLADVGPQADPEWQDWMEAGYGSNNWVVSGELTRSGLPLFANDPHRGISIPPLRYVVHLIGPGWNVIGSGEPTVPGVSMGHNEYGGFGLTIHGLDMEDLYVYDTNPSNPSQYRYQGSWEDMRIIQEPIPVKNEEAVTVDLKFTRHGPVLYEDEENNKAYALRAAWLETGAAPYLADLRYGQASNWQEFREGAFHHLGPAHNIVWADVHGDIGWQVAGIAPLRDWSGLLPVPGDGRFEWDGYLPIEQLPHELNPEKGFFASANEHNVPADYPHTFSYNFSEPFRSARIHELLGSSTGDLTVQDMDEIQHDRISIPARSLVPLLQSVDPEEADVQQAREMLLSWNYALAENSVPAAIYISWERQLRDELREMYVPEAVRDMIGGIPTVRLIEWLTTPDEHFGGEPAEARGALLERSLTQALTDLRQRLGPDMSQWQYGQEAFKHITIRHLLSDLVRDDIRERLDVGPLPRGGTGYTVNPTGSGDLQTSGPSYRIVADVSDWDNSVGITMPGQSGDPASPHYSDLFVPWATGEHIPLLFSRPSVESVAERRLLLTPGQ